VRILMTGGTGFIGSYVARQLLGRGDEVAAYDLLPDRNTLQQILTPEEAARVEIVAGDVTDLPHLLATVKRVRPERIVHLAYLLTTACQANPPLALHVNGVGTINVFEAARTLDVPRVVWASSIAVFGRRSVGPDGVVANDAPHDPATIYGVCKSLNERYARHYARAYQLDLVGLRFPVVYGPGRARGGGQFVHELIERPALGLPGRVPYADEAVNWGYVEDIAAAVVAAVDAPELRTRIYTIGGGVATVREAAAHVRAVLPDADLTLESGGTTGLLARFDTAPAAAELGWTPRIDLAEGIRRTIAYWQARRA
jgi:nucleoside-diphosphate-sugar epimerase